MVNPLYKWAAMHPIVRDLIQAKKHSDRSEYPQKTEIVHRLLKDHPDQFFIDSRQQTTVGLTHKPSGFKIHIRKSALPFEFLQKENMQKVAYFGSLESVGELREVLS